MPQKGLNPPSRKATADVKGDGVWGSGKDFPQKFFSASPKFQSLSDLTENTRIL